MRKLLSLLFVCFGVTSYAQLCAGSTGTINAQNPQNLGNPQYSLNPGGFFPISGTNQFAISPLVTTSYTIYTTGTNSNNVVVTTTAALQVTVLPQPIATPTVIQPNCTSTVSGLNLGLTFLPASPVPQYTIVWSSIPNGVLTSQQTSVASGVTAGPYSATIIAAGGCGYITTLTVNAPPAPANFSLTPFAQTMTLNCITPTIDITASNTALNYTWSSICAAPISGTNAVNLNSTCLGGYTITGQEPTSLCSKTLTFTLVQDLQTPTLTANPLFQNITCTTAIQTVSMTSNPTLNVQYIVNDPFGGIVSIISNTAIFGPSPGQTTVNLVNLVNGCSSTKIVTVVPSQAFPTFSLQSPQSFTLGCSTKSVATLNVVGATGFPIGAPVSYTLLAPGTPSALPGGTLSSFSTYSINVPGQYTVVVRDNTSFCDTRSNISILAYTATPNITTTQDFLVLDCNHTVTTLYGASETPNVSFNWGYLNLNTPSSTVAAQASLTAVTNTVVNIYTLTITDNSSTCRSTSVVTIYQNLYPPKAQFALGTASISCKTPTITLTNTSFTTIKTNAVITNSTDPVVGFLWQGPTPQENVFLSTTYISYVPGVYTITAKDINNGCVSTATQVVDDYRDFPKVTFSSKTATLDCGAGICLTPAYNPTTSLTYTWSWSHSKTAGTPTLPSLCVVEYAGTYSVVVTNTANGCVAVDSIKVVPGFIAASFEVDKKEGYAPLTVNAVNNSSTAVSSLSISSYYSFGNGTFSTTAQTSVGVSALYKHPGTYSLALTVAKGGCMDTMVTFIKVLLPSKLEVPNIFTPNGDGVNDFYFLNAASMSSITFTIHDRWGHLVYEVTSSTGNVLWDGMSQTGVECADGTYFYILKATGRDGVAYDQNGTIQLIR
jgi:gliding motility-associated-like protein